MNTPLHDALIVTRPYLVAQQPDNRRSILLSLSTNKYIAVSPRYEEALRVIAGQPMTTEQLAAIFPWIDTVALCETGLIEYVPAEPRSLRIEVIELWARIVLCRIYGRRRALRKVVRWTRPSPPNSLQDGLVVLRLRAAAETARLLPFSSKWCTYVAVALAEALRFRHLPFSTRVLVSADGTEFHADVLSGDLTCDPANHSFEGQSFKVVPYER